MKWSKKDEFARQEYSQTIIKSPFGKTRTKIISGQYDTRFYCDQISSIKFDGSKPILVVSKCMLSLFIPSSEVVKEGRILKKTKQLTKLKNFGRS